MQLRSKRVWARWISIERAPWSKLCSVASADAIRGVFDPPGAFTPGAMGSAELAGRRDAAVGLIAQAAQRGWARRSRIGCRQDRDDRRREVPQEHQDDLLPVAAAGSCIDEADAAERDLPGIVVKVARTLMQSEADRDRLAVEALAFADELAALTQKVSP